MACFGAGLRLVGKEAKMSLNSAIPRLLIGVLACMACTSPLVAADQEGVRELKQQVKALTERRAEPERSGRDGGGGMLVLSKAGQMLVEAGSTAEAAAWCASALSSRAPAPACQMAWARPIASWASCPNEARHSMKIVAGCSSISFSAWTISAAS
jgi:hypothetical protein